MNFDLLMAIKKSLETIDVNNLNYDDFIMFYDKEINTTSIRISLSHFTTKLEINEFVRIFYKVYDELLLKK